MGGDQIGLVVSGGGARGAYEAGALSVLLPALEKRGERPTLYIGASVGTLNAVVLASHHQLGTAGQVAKMLETWRSIELSSVIRPIVAQAPIAAFFAAAQLLALPGLRLRSVLDNSPLKANTERWVDWPGLRSAIDDDGVVFCAVAMSARTGKTVVFVDAAQDERFHRSHSVAYVRVQTKMEHINASGALPVLWPPVLVEDPPKARGWYFDGGLRTNAPIKPALDLGAERLIVLAVDSIAGPVLTSDVGARSEEEPDLSVALVHLLEGTLTDPLINDMRRLGMINEYLVGDSSLGTQLYRTIRGKATYKRVPYIFSGPRERGTIGQLASDIYGARYGGLKWLRNPDYRLISGLLGGHGPTHGELLSLLFFDPEFIEALIGLGADDARTWLEEDHDGDGPWQEGSLTTFTRPRQWTAG